MTVSTPLSATEIAKLLRARECSAVEVTAAHLATAESIAPLNAFTAITADRAMQMAAAADRRLADGEDSPLLGVPVAAKDLYCTVGERTQACSRILDGFRPTYESFVTEQLWKAGAVLLGKTNMDEFAMGSSTEHGADGVAINPWRKKGSDKALIPGGSSGGSAIAVATGAVPLALGTDTGGSIRQPAAFCGIVGIKPTYGRCSRWGIIAFASSFDQAGPFARSVADAALALDAITGHDARDSTSSPRPPTECLDGIANSIKGCRIGIPKEYRIEGGPAETTKLWEQAADWLREAGAEIVEVSLPHTSYALPAYYVIAPAEASSNLARYDGVRYGYRAEPKPGAGDIEALYQQTRAEGFGAEVRRRILIGTYALSQGYYDAYYLRAQRVRALIRQDFETCFANGINAILTPTTPEPAFAVGENIGDPVSMYLNDVFTVTANLAGLPGVSVPAGFSASGLPLGVQLIGRPWAEAELLSLAARLEAAADTPPVPEAWWTSS